MVERGSSRERGEKRETAQKSEGEDGWMAGKLGTEGTGREKALAGRAVIGPIGCAASGSPRLSLSLSLFHH